MKTQWMWLILTLTFNAVFATTPSFSVVEQSKKNEQNDTQLGQAPEHFHLHKTFTTWQGIEPDKWATLWFIKRYLSLDATFLLVPPGEQMPSDAISFGVPNAQLKRGNRQSMFHHLKVASGVSSEVIEALDGIIYDLEVNIWEAPSDPRVAWIETLYRQLQFRYQRDQVPVDCYLQFFDGVAVLLAQPDAGITDYRTQLALTQTCPGLLTQRADFVAQMDHLSLLRALSLGKKIRFIDTREYDEFKEIHLPMAQWLPLRHVNAERVSDLMDADIIVPYCIKDFRGFEVAKAIRQQLDRHPNQTASRAIQVATLSPNGLKGWRQAALPTVTHSDEEDTAQAALMQCAMEPQTCLVNPSND